MTFRDRYRAEPSWYGRVCIMEIYHLAMSQQTKTWTLTKTAEYFGVSIGLVSENLKLAKASHSNLTILKTETRQEALKKFKNGRY